MKRKKEQVLEQEGSQKNRGRRGGGRMKEAGEKGGGKEDWVHTLLVYRAEREWRER